MDVTPCNFIFRLEETSTLKMEAAGFVRNVGTFPPTKQYHIPEDTVYNLTCENLKFYFHFAVRLLLGKRPVVFCFITLVCGSCHIYKTNSCPSQVFNFLGKACSPYAIVRLPSSPFLGWLIWQETIVLYLGKFSTWRIMMYTFFPDGS